MRVRRSAGGSSLIGAVVAMAIVAVCLVMVVRTYIMGRRYVAVQTQRAQALGLCQQQIERLRAAGYHSLPAEGEHAFSAAAGSGKLIVAAGPVADSRTVTARLSWPAAETIPAGQVEVATIMSARGLSP